MKSDDPMWEEFRPLWTDLQAAGSRVFVAGGYGLFLKQHWLLSHRDHPVVIAPENWLDITPRVTKDLDIIIGLELLASRSAQGVIAQAMARNQFEVVEENPRWQFQKRVASGQKILVDFHSELPKSENKHLALDKLRVKHKPSLGEGGIHGRQNPEAAGSELHPFQFQTDGIAILVPNPVTWSLMKLIAARDRKRRADDAARDEEYRTFHREHALKHARDVARVVAMTTRAERDRAVEVVDVVRQEPAFSDVVDACDQIFLRDQAWGADIAARMWRAEDWKLIRSILTDWFRQFARECSKYIHCLTLPPNVPPPSLLEMRSADLL